MAEQIKLMKEIYKSTPKWHCTNVI